MAKMLAIRLHLDESNEDNGPLRVIPGSHKAGCLAAGGSCSLERAAKRYLHRSQRRRNIDAPSLGSCFVFMLKA
jgi:ectoine hydroxylase-related dioxygenase (phytanoyl-CoA dioxygenase family)